MGVLIPVKLENKPLPIAHVDIYTCMLKDNRISWRARFLHCYLRAFSNGYHFYASKLATDLNWNRHTVDTALRELQAAALLDRTEARGEGGIFMGFVYTVYPVRRDLYRRLLAEASRSG